MTGKGLLDKIDIELVTASNVDKVKKLKIKNEQKGFCETTEECLRDALIYECYVPVALSIADETIGFAMYGFFQAEGKEGRAWLDRLFIGDEYQGKGYGRRSTITLLNKMFCDFGVDEVFLSVYENNTTAIKLYLSLGFEFNGEKDFGGEDVMTLSKYIAIEKGIING